MHAADRDLVHSGSGDADSSSLQRANSKPGDRETLRGQHEVARTNLLGDNRAQLQVRQRVGRRRNVRGSEAIDMNGKVLQSRYRDVAEVYREARIDGTDRATFIDIGHDRKRDVNVPIHPDVDGDGDAEFTQMDDTYRRPEIEIREHKLTDLYRCDGYLTD